jgi:hypothetical protein
MQRSKLAAKMARGVTGAFLSAAMVAGFIVADVTIASATTTPTHLVITVQPSSTAQSGIAFGTQPVVQIEDASNNVVSTTSTITATITSPGTGTLTSASMGATAGVATFSGLTLSATVGTYTLTFTDSADSLPSVVSASITLSAGTATQLAITTQPSPGEISGVALVRQPVVAVEDATGNVVTTVSSGTATFAITGACTSTGSSASGTFAAGVATFSGLTMTGASATSCTLAFTGGGFTSSASSPIVMSGQPTQLVIKVGPPSTATSGAPLIPQPEIWIEDAANTRVQADSSTVTAVLANPSAGSSLTNATAVAVAGQATFSGLAINALASTYALTFNDGGLASATSGNITLSGGGGAKLVVHTQPSTTAVNGVALVQQPVIWIEDTGGNLDTANTSTVTATFTSGGVSLDHASATFSGGQATFSGLALTALAGNYTLTFSDGALTSAVSTTITVSAGAATRLVITTQPSATVASGSRLSIQPVVKIEDTGGNVVTSNNTAVTAAISSSSYTVSYGTVSAVAGVASFSNLALNAPIGAYTLTFTDSPLAAVVSSTVSVTSAAPTKLVITTQPSSTVASGVALAQVPVVRVEDSSGNIVTSDNSVVVARITSGGVSVSANAQTAVAGTATFYGLALNALAGTYTLTFSDGALAAATSTNITVYVGPANKLVITTEPSTSVQSGAVLATQPVVAVEDSGGNVVTTSTGTITAGIAVGTGGAITTGSTATIASGIARFSGLSITGTSGGVYGLVFSGAGLSVTDTARITVGSVQAPLVITKLKGWFGRTLRLATAGGSGTGAVTFGVSSPGTAGCTITGTVLSYTHVGTCVIIAIKAASGVYPAISSAQTTITIALLPKPGMLILGYGPSNVNLNAGQVRAIARLANRLSTHSRVRIVLYTPRNVGLARARALAVRRILLSRVHLSVQIILSTHTGARQARLITLSQ